MLTPPITSVWPSGRALATEALPIAPFAPGRCRRQRTGLNRSDRPFARTRVTTSVAPPAGNGTTIVSDATDRSAPMPCATRPAARQRPLPDAEIVGEVVSWTFLFEMQATLHPRRVSESGRICRIVCDCACRRHQCCQLFRTRNAAHLFMSSSWASRAPSLYAHRIALENYAPALVDGNPAFNSRSWLRGFAAGAHDCLWHEPADPKCPPHGRFRGVSSIGQCNTSCSLLAGVSKAKVFRGR